MTPTTSEEALRALSTSDAEARRLVVRALESAPPEAGCGVLHRVLGDADWRVRKEAVQLAHALADRADVVPLLVEALRAPAEEVALRNAAVEALAALGGGAVDAVETLLGRPDDPLDADARKLAVEVLAAARLPRSVGCLVTLLADEDANVRAAAAEALGWIGGDRAIEALRGLLAARDDGERADDRFLRLVALEGCNRLAAPIELARVVPFLGDKILRHAAVAALARCDEDEALARAASAIGDPSRHVAEAAVQSCAALLRARRRPLALEPGRARERLLGAVNSSDAQIRRAAIAVLAAGRDPSAVDAIVSALHDEEVAEEAEAALLSMDDDALAPLLEVANGDGVETRIAALEMLPRFVDRVPAERSSASHAIPIGRSSIVAALWRGVVAREPDVVAAAAHALSITSAPLDAGPDRVRALLAAASGKEPRAAAAALKAMRVVARRSADAVRPHLLEVDPSSEEAAIACSLLAVIGGVDHVPWLSAALSSGIPRTRRAAVEALGRIGGDAPARAIALATTDEDADVALAAIKALGRARDDAGLSSPGVAALVRLVGTHHDPTIVAAAARALGATADTSGAAALRPLVHATDPAIACSALDALADLAVDDLRAIAVSAFAHPSPIVVRAALDVLGESPHARDVDRLVAEVTPLLMHPSWEVRRRLVELFAKLAEDADAPLVEPLLRARLDTEDEPAVRAAITDALAALAASDGHDREGRGE